MRIALWTKKDQHQDNCGRGSSKTGMTTVPHGHQKNGNPKWMRTEFGQACRAWECQLNKQNDAKHKSSVNRELTSPRPGVRFSVW